MMLHATNGLTPPLVMHAHFLGQHVLAGLLLDQPHSNFICSLHTLLSVAEFVTLSVGETP